MGGAVVAALVVVVALSSRGAGKASTACGGQVSQSADHVPGIEGRDIASGAQLRLEPGQPTLLNVWGSWCGPCRVEQPLLVRAAGRHPEVRFLGIDVQDNDAAGQGFQREFHVPYPSISDSGREVASRLRAGATPVTVVVDRAGTIRGRHLGLVDADTLECMIGLVST